MSRSVRLNTLCPCGSGRKFKKCCKTGVKDTRLQYLRWREIEQGLSSELLRFANELLGLEGIEHAWSRFNLGASREKYDPASPAPIGMLFLPWLIFNWVHHEKVVDSGELLHTTIAESFLRVYEVSPEEEKFILSCNRRPYSFYEVTSVTPGSGMTLVDLFRGVEVQVHEHLASQDLEPGEILYCATAWVDGISFNIGTGCYRFSALDKAGILVLRERLIELTDSGEFTEYHLDLFRDAIRGWYLSDLGYMSEPPLEEAEATPRFSGSELTQNG